MALKLSQLIAALPEMADETSAAGESELPEAIARTSMRPIPVGRFRRMTVLGTLQAKIAAAYIFHWLRGWFRSAEANDRHLG